MSHFWRRSLILPLALIYFLPHFASFSKVKLWIFTHSRIYVPFEFMSKLRKLFLWNLEALHPMSLLIFSQASEAKNKLKLRLSKNTTLSTFQHFFTGKKCSKFKNSRNPNVKNLDERRRKIFKGKILEIHEQLPAFLWGELLSNSPS